MSSTTSYLSVMRRDGVVLGPAADEEGIGLVGFGTAIAGGLVIFVIQLLMFFILRSVKRLALI